MRHDDGDPAGRTKLTATEARQGTTRYPVRYILAASLVLAVIALLAAYLLA